MTEFREAAFCSMDRDWDGINMVAWVMGFLNGDPIEEEMEVMIEEGDGTIDIMCRKMKENVDEEVTEAFNVLDRDQDGFISAFELRNVMLNLGERLSEEEAEEMIKEADFDGDGVVSFEEFARMMIMA